MREVKLSNSNLKAIVSDEDYPIVCSFNWRLSTQGYAVHSIRVEGKEILVRMHRIIMQPSKFEVIDHINGNKLDNTRENLRITNKRKNSYNKKKILSSTGWKGVYNYKNRFRAAITKGDKEFNIGIFDSAEEAAAAYDKKAVEFFGEFAATNEMILSERMIRLKTIKEKK